MSLEELLEKGKIEKIEMEEAFVNKVFKIAGRDLKSAEDMFEDENYDWTLAIAYNAMLQAGRAFMFSKGYRPAGEYRHVSVVLFMTNFDEFGDLNIYLDRLRKKRHKAIYEQPESVSREEAEQAINWAKEFIEKIKETFNSND